MGRGKAPREDMGSLGEGRGRVEEDTLADQWGTEGSLGADWDPEGGMHKVEEGIHNMEQDKEKERGREREMRKGVGLQEL